MFVFYSGLPHFLYTIYIQVAEVSHYMQGIATIVFKGKRTVKSVNLARDVLYNEVKFYIASITPTVILLTCNNSPLHAGYGSSHSNKVRTTVQ